ncbi:MAG: hypothetical protein ABIJ12_14930 [bacterium]
MKKSLISLSALVMLALIISCAADIILEPPETLEGNYVGEYIYRVRGTGASEDTSIQRITWTFTETTWDMNLDFDNPDFNMDFCICEPFGQYLLEDRLRLQENGSQPNGALCSSCNESFNPDGQFLLDRSTDTLVMTQQVTSESETVVKQIRLLKVYDTQ